MFSPTLRLRQGGYRAQKITARPGPGPKFSARPGPVKTGPKNSGPGPGRAGPVFSGLRKTLFYPWSPLWYQNSEFFNLYKCCLNVLLKQVGHSRLCFWGTKRRMNELWRSFGRIPMTLRSFSENRAQNSRPGPARPGPARLPPC